MTWTSALLRTAQLVPTIAGILLLTFILIHAAPGDPVLALAGEHGDQGYYDDMRARFALDRPLAEQLSTFAARTAAGDLGNSWVQGRPARDVIGERIGPTVILTGSALALSVLLGLILGGASALRAGRPLDHTLNAMTLVLYSAPVFLVAQVALVLLVLAFPVLPSFGMRSPGEVGTGAAGLQDLLRHLILPASVLAAPQLAGVARLTRSALLTELRQPYVRTAKAKGLGPVAVLRHAARLSLLPVITLIGNRMGQLLGGAVIVESIFGWPGLGTLLLDSTQNRDGPVLLGIFLVVSVSVVVANLLTDLTYGWLDPRTSDRRAQRLRVSPGVRASFGAGPR